MKRRARFVLLLVTCICYFVQEAKPHKQHLHQYLTIEGYNLLRQQIGQDIPSLQNHLGGMTPFYAGDRAWQRNYLTTGAWREDEEDIVYWYSRSNPPTITGLGGAVYDFIALFGGIRPDGFVSSTHFWDADNGDALATDMEGTYIGLHWLFTVPNAHVKLQKFGYPYRSWIMQYHDGSAGHVSTFDLAGGGQITYTWYSYLGFEYNTLPDLYTNGRAWIVGYYDNQGQWIDHNVRPDILPRQVVLGSGWRDTFIWEILGRMCHLMQDQSVPAHAHRDAHGSSNPGIQEDSFENWVGGAGDPYSYWNHTNVGDVLFPPPGLGPLHYLMYTTQQISDHFGTNGPYEGDGNDIPGGNPISEELQYLNSIGLSTLGEPTGMAGPFDVTRLANIRDKTLPQAIRATAGLLSWFASETGMLHKVTVKNDFNSGQVIVNGSSYASGIQFGFVSNMLITVATSTPQISGAYVRHFEQWQKLDRFDRVVSSNGGISWSTTVDGNHTYKAKFNREFNVALASPQYAESGSGGMYRVNGAAPVSTWSGTFVENGLTPISIEAIPPTGWGVGYWSDVNTTDLCRTIVPNDHTTLTATFKKHLASTSSKVTAPSTQRKIIRDANSNYHMVYESASEIWYTRSMDAGATWSPEIKISDDANYINGRPSITVMKTDNVHLIWVVWERFLSQHQEGHLHEIVSCEIDPDLGPMQIESVGMTNGVLPLEFLANPVIGSAVDSKDEPYVLAVWYDQSVRRLRGATHGADGGWSSTQDLHSGSVLDFTIAPVAKRAGGKDGILDELRATHWDIVWYEGTTLYHARMEAAYNPTMGSTEVVSPATEVGVPFASPTAINVADLPAVAWWEYPEGYNQRVIKYKERASDSWPSAVNVWSPYKSTYETPTLSGGDNTSDNVTIAWLRGTSSIYHVQRLNSSWTNPAYLATGVNPMISVGYNSSPQELILSRGTLTPYSIQKTSISTDNSPPRTSPGSLAEGRGGKVIFPHGSLHLAILKATVNGTPLGFITVNDTARVRDTTTFAAALNSTPFVGQGILQMRLLYAKHGALPGTALFRLLLRDQADRVVQVLRSFIDKRDSMFTITVPLNFGNRLLRVALEPRGVVQHLGFEVERWIVEEDSSMQNEVLAAAKKEDPKQQVPTEYALHLNYPNPFNPTTEIRFDLPDAGNVSLVVYDVLGRQVVELANGYREAGYHSATWNAAGQASGVYFARFGVINAEGKSVYSKVNKLILMK